MFFVGEQNVERLPGYRPTTFLTISHTFLRSPRGDANENTHTVNYYISWTHSDAIYQQYLPNIGVLVSPPNVNLSWTVERWPVLPHTLLIDSGAFQHHQTGRLMMPEQVLRRQIDMVSGTDVPVGLCHLDVPMMGARDLNELRARVHQSLLNARWLIERAADYSLPERARLVGVIQGYSRESIYNSALALADMGYTNFALGSLARMVASARGELISRVEAALEAVGPCIHVLGVSSVAVLTELAKLKIESADSGAPIHEAWRGGIFYSQPFRRFKLASPRMREWSRSYSFADILDAPLPCDCPVCHEDSTRLMHPVGKIYINLRALHNTYHLAREIADF